MRILVIGASSYVGARIFEEVKKLYPETRGTSFSDSLFDDLIETDVTDKKSIENAFILSSPQVVIVAAAVSNQASVIKDLQNARRVNVEGCINIIEVAKKYDSKIIYLSSEAVFQKNEYAQLKKEAEAVIIEHCDSYLILRLGMCFGRSPNTINDRPHNRLLRALEKKQVVTFDSALSFYATEIGHLSSIIVSLIQGQNINEIIDVISMPETNRFEIARAALDPEHCTVEETVTPNDISLPPMNDQKLRNYGLKTMSKEEFLATIKKDVSDYAKKVG